MDVLVYRAQTGVLDRHPSPEESWVNYPNLAISSYSKATASGMAQSQWSDRSGKIDCHWQHDDLGRQTSALNERRLMEALFVTASKQPQAEASAILTPANA